METSEYITPSIREIRMRCVSVICISDPSLQGSVGHESFEEDNLDW